MKTINKLFLFTIFFATFNSISASESKSASESISASEFTIVGDSPIKHPDWVQQCKPDQKKFFNAAEAGDVDELNRLIAKGVDVNAKKRRSGGMTALHLATTIQHPLNRHNTMTTLMFAGAITTSKNDEGLSPFDIIKASCKKDCEQIPKFMLDGIFSNENKAALVELIGSFAESLCPEVTPAKREQFLAEIFKELNL